jgi:mycothiol synthase
MPHPTQLVMRRPDLEDLPVLTVPTECTLRRATAADSPGLVALLTTAYDEAWDEERVFTSFFYAVDVKATFVIVRDGQFVATASAAFRPDRFPAAGYLHWVGAHPQHARQGLGLQVSLAVLHEFVALGLVAAVLETDDHRLPAIRTYSKLGFHPFHCHRTHPARWRAVREALKGRGG